MSSPVATVEADLKPLLQQIKSLASNYFTHGVGQAIAWYTIATHDLSKWESAAAAAGTLAVTSAAKRISGWLSK